MENAEEEGLRLAQDIQRRLAESAEPATRVWFEERVRLGRWRGNKSDSSRRAVFAAVAQWMGEESGAGGGIRWGGGVARYYAALALMRSVYSDDKLAGMILFQELVLPDPSAATFLYRPPPEEGADGDDAECIHTAVKYLPMAGPVLRDVAEIFHDTGPGGVHDWSTGDWMSTKVLGPYAARHPRLAGRRAVWRALFTVSRKPAAAARELMRWAGLDGAATSVWMRRAGMTAFVNLVSSARRARGVAASAEAPTPPSEDAERDGREEGRRKEGRGGGGGGGGGGGAGVYESGDTQGVRYEQTIMGEDKELSAGRHSFKDSRGRVQKQEKRDDGVYAAAGATGVGWTLGGGGTQGVHYEDEQTVRGGDELFGEGFVVELSATCGAALARGGGASSFDVDEDLAVWVQTGAQWMLSLCARESRRMSMNQKKRAKHIHVEGDASAAAAAAAGAGADEDAGGGQCKYSYNAGSPRSSKRSRK